MNYFKDVTNVEELRKSYKSLAKELHPDLNSGSDEAFKDMLNQYDELMKNGFTNSDVKAEFDLSSMTEEFIKAYNVISELDVEFEIIGSWIWIGDGSYAVKDKLKEIGCKYASKKKKWYFGKMETKKRSKGMKYTDIRNKYGVHSANVKVKIV